MGDVTARAPIKSSGRHVCYFGAQAARAIVTREHDPVA